MYNQNQLRENQVLGVYWFTLTRNRYLFNLVYYLKRAVIPIIVAYLPFFFIKLYLLGILPFTHVRCR